MDMKWRETGSKIGVALAGYVNPGPLRAPFRHIPEDVIAERREAVQQWQGLCEKYKTPRRVPGLRGDAAE
jgi:hypothetical protein